MREGHVNKLLTRSLDLLDSQKTFESTSKIKKNELEKRLKHEEQYQLLHQQGDPIQSEGSRNIGHFE
eukprot:Pgem_evm1s12298